MVILSLVLSIVLPVIFPLVFNHFSHRNNQRDIESVKNHLQKQLHKDQEMLMQKIQVYNDLIDSLRLFIKVEDDGERKEEREEYYRLFIKSYNSCWLWASDEVLNALNNYVTLNLVSKGENKEAEKEFLSDIVIEMRKDIGFPETVFKNEHYLFIK